MGPETNKMIKVDKKSYTTSRHEIIVGTFDYVVSYNFGVHYGYTISYVSMENFVYLDTKNFFWRVC